ncbi:MAG: MarR family transcriptional regulator [Deltaproteobacteria bacterium]|nr:MarR family transcriptional regulator [Deltaproteobacteria bacterium]TLN03612.1 MAG: MarR family transcriptional regulator [bacterium]
MERIVRIAEMYPQIMKVMGRLRSTLHEGMDLSYNQFKMLLAINDKGICPLTTLAAELSIAMSSASEMVDKLVHLGLVCRSVDAESRRRVTIQLTSEGEKLISDLQKGIVENYRSLLNRLSDSDQSRLVDALETLVEILGHSSGAERNPERSHTL